MAHRYMKTNNMLIILPKHPKIFIYIKQKQRLIHVCIFIQLELHIFVPMHAFKSPINNNY